MAGDWQEEFRRKTVSAEEAVRVIKSGDRVSFTHGREPPTVTRAIFARKALVDPIEKHFPDWGENELVPLTDHKEDLIIIIVGGPAKHSAYLPAFLPPSVTKAIEN